MITAVLLLLLPAVLGMSVFRLYQLPRDLRARRVRIRSPNGFAYTIAFGTAYGVLATYTILVLYVIANVVWTPPSTFLDLFPGAYVMAGYPVVYVGVEWVLYYCLKPVGPI